MPASPDPAVSVLILATRDTERLTRCLEALARHAADQAPCETILVLNAAEPEVHAFVNDRVIGARVATAQVNAGTAASWNLGLEGARGRWIHVLHEDSEVHDGWLAPLIAAFDEPGVAVSGSRLFNPHGTLQSSGWTVWADGSSTQVNEDTAPGIVRRAAPLAVDWVSSASLLVPRAFLHARGGFNESFGPAGGVDADLGVDAWGRGHSVLSVPSSVVTHASGAMVAEDGGPLASEVFREFLAERHRRRLERAWPTHLAARPQLRWPSVQEDVARVLGQLESERAATRALELADAPPGSHYANASWACSAEREQAFRDRQGADEHAFLAWLVGDALVAARAERDQARSRVVELDQSLHRTQERVAELDDHLHRAHLRVAELDDALDGARRQIAESAAARQRPWAMARAALTSLGERARRLSGRRA